MTETATAFFTYKPDGRTEIALLGRVAVLRRPKVGEIRELRQLWEAESDRPDEDLDELRVELAAVQALTGADVRRAQDDAPDEEAGQQITAEFVERLNHFRDLSKRVRDRNEDARIMWLTVVLQTLDESARTPSEEEYPGDVLRGTWPRDVIQHWLGGGLPLDSGSGSSET